MIDIKTLPLKIGNYERKSPTDTLFVCTVRNGCGCTISAKSNTATFGAWIPIGATILKEAVETNEDVINLLERATDPLTYKRSKAQ